MNNLRILLKAELINGLSLNQWFQKGYRRRSFLRMAIVTLIAVLACLIALSLSSVYMFGLSRFLYTIGAVQYYTAFAVILPWIIIFFMSLYMMPGDLFMFRDFDLLMALPVRPPVIVAVKMIFLYLVNAALTVLIAGPIFVISGPGMHAGWVYYVIAVLAIPFIPLLPMLLGALAAYVIGRFSARFRSAQYVLLAVSMLLLLAICTLPLLMTGLFGGTTIQTAGAVQIIGRLCRILYPSVLLMNALRSAGVLSLIAFVLINALPFVFFMLIFSSHFLAVRAQLKETGRPASHHQAEFKASGLLTALFRKELKNYFSTYVYILNTSFGMILLTFLVIVLAAAPVPFPGQLGELMRQERSLLPMLTAVLSFTVCLTCTTASSISLDGKTIWLDRSLPVPVTSVFLSKILLNLAVILPLLFVDVIILSLRFSLSPAAVLFLLAIPSLYGVFIACSGLLINLRFPKLVWSSPTVPVKQSLSVILSALSGFAACAVPFVLYLQLHIDSRFFLLVLTILLLLFDGWIGYKLKTTGAALYRNLE